MLGNGIGDLDVAVDRAEPHVTQEHTAGGMLDSRKPDPAMLLHTIACLGGGPSLYVGDSEIDAETARRAVVPFALYTQGYRKSPVSELPHDWRFDNFAALEGIVAAFARTP